MLQSMGSESVGHDLATEQQTTVQKYVDDSHIHVRKMKDMCKRAHFIYSSSYRVQESIIICGLRIICGMESGEGSSGVLILLQMFSYVLLQIWSFCRI